MGNAIMVLGTASSVGKSMVVTGLCKLLSMQGLKVAPFKSQNMSRTAFRTQSGALMSMAQAMQAEACGMAADPRMNPILLCPKSDTGSEVYLMGKHVEDMSAKDYYAKKAAFWPVVQGAFESLAAEVDVVVVEGAGSPAEINLQRDDFVNLGLAERLDLPCLLVGDIDRGGVFAALYGTLALVPDAWRKRVKGLMINKFRGDMDLLKPGLDQLEALCGVPVLGCLPYLKLSLDEEDSLHSGEEKQSGFRAEDRPLREEDYLGLAEQLKKSLDWARLKACFSLDALKDEGR